MDSSTIAHPAPPAHRPQRADAIANHERILCAARELFASRGANTEMRDIAERAGVGVGTLYRHFASRDALFFGLLNQTREATLARLREAAALPDPRDALRATAHAMAAAHAMHGALFAAMRDARVPLPPPGDDTAACAAPPCGEGTPNRGGFVELRAVIAATVERGVAAGIFRANADVDTAVTVLVACLGPPASRLDARDSAAAADALTDFVLAALAPRERCR